MRRFRFVIFVLLLLAGAAFAYLRMQPRQKDNPYKQLPSELVSQGSFVVTIDELGVLAAERNETVSPPFKRARIVKLLDDGTFVEKGQTVAWMDVQEAYSTLEDQINQLRTIKADLESNIEDIRMSLGNDLLDLESAAAQLEFNQLKLIDVNRTLITKETLRDSQLASERDVDSAVLNSASSTLTALQSDLDYKQAFENRESQKKIKSLGLGKLERRRDKALDKIEEQKDMLDKAEVKAPSSGVFLVTQEYDHGGGKARSVGDTLDMDEPIGTIPDMDSLVVRTQISESAITRVKTGMHAKIVFDALPDLELSGEIATVGAAAIERERSPAGMLAQSTDTSGLKVFEIKIRLDNIDKRLRPNMTTNVSFMISERDDALFIPMKCVFNKGGHKIAYVLTPEGYEKRELALGERNRQSVIVEKGLKPGERVIAVDLEKKTDNGESSTSAASSLAGMTM